LDDVFFAVDHDAQLGYQLPITKSVFTFQFARQVLIGDVFVNALICIERVVIK